MFPLLIARMRLSRVEIEYFVVVTFAQRPSIIRYFGGEGGGDFDGSRGQTSREAESSLLERARTRRGTRLQALPEYAREGGRGGGDSAPRWVRVAPGISHGSRNASATKEDPGDARARARAIFITEKRDRLWFKIERYPTVDGEICSREYSSRKCETK